MGTTPECVGFLALLSYCVSVCLAVFLSVCSCGDEGATRSWGVSLTAVEHVLPRPAVWLCFCLSAAVVMKVPKPKGDEEPRKVWVPMERLWFDKNQRVQV